MRRRQGEFAVALLVGLLVGLGCRVEDTAAPGLPAPEWTLEDLAGRKVSLADFRGRPVVLDFWATWCVPCEFTIPVLNQLHERYGERVAVVGVAVDAGGREVVAPFAEERKMAYRVLLGDEGLARGYGALGFPSLYVIRGDGRIALSHTGLIEPEALEAAVESALRAGREAPAG